MKDKIIEILSKHSTCPIGEFIPSITPMVIEEGEWGAVADEILVECSKGFLDSMQTLKKEDSDKVFYDMLDFGQCAVVVTPNGIKYIDASPRKMIITDNKKQIEAEYLELFNRIKKDFHQKRGKRCTPTRTLSKPAQLHTALKTYSLDELGRVILNVFGDKFHQDNMWRYATTSYCVRLETIEKYL